MVSMYIHTLETYQESNLTPSHSNHHRYTVHMNCSLKIYAPDQAKKKKKKKATLHTFISFDRSSQVVEWQSFSLPTCNTGSYVQEL